MANKLVKITNIDYDTDGENIPLPTELCIEITDEVLDHYGDDIDLCIADAISDKTGFCVNWFDFEIKNK